MNEVALCSGERAALLENVHCVRDGRAPELCNRKPCFDRLRVRRSRSRCGRSHFIEPERRFKLKGKKYHAVVTARNRSLSDSPWRPVQKLAKQGFEQGL